MESLLLDRKLGNITPLEFATTIVESYYSRLHQTAKTNVFPINCHHNASVNSLAIDQSDYGFLLSGCADSSIKLWDLSQTEVQRKENEIDSNLVSSSYDDFDYDNPISTFVNVATIPKKTIHEFGISTVQWWPHDTGMFVSSSFDHSVKIWDTNELRPVHDFDIQSRVYSIDICSSDDSSSLVATASDSPFIRLLDLRAASSAHTLSGHKGKTLSVKWHPINSYLLASGGYDGEVKVWDVRRSNSCLCRLDMLHTNIQKKNSYSSNLAKESVKAHSGPVNGLVWDESGTELYTTGNDDKVRVWDMVSDRSSAINKLVNFGPLTRNKYPQTIPMMLNPKRESETQYLLFPSESSDIFIFRTIDGKLQARLSRKGTKNSGRTCSMVNAGPFTGTYYCGTMDGEIISWSPNWIKPNLDDIVELESSEELNLESEVDVLDKKKKQSDTLASLYSDPYFK
ncbi:DNA excision repair protein ckn1 [Spathaspora sp. JA1]|nr:DNA excision repair protein ckn1 [Spathaspora sp. JA1]